MIKRKKGEKKKQNPFFLLKFLGKEYKELNTFELRPNMKHAKLPSVDHHHPTGLDTWNLLTNRVRKMVGKHNQGKMLLLTKVKLSGVHVQLTGYPP